jgi:hypothetical protein
VKFGDFIDAFVAATYLESELTGKTVFRVSEILDRYHFEFKESWAGQLFKDYNFTDRITARRHLGPVRDQLIELSPNGTRWVEDKLGENVSQFLEQHGLHRAEDGNSGAFDPDYFDPEYFDTGSPKEGRVSLPETVVESASWTGLSKVRIDARNAAAVSSLIDEAIGSLAGDENAKIAQARALLRAAKELTDAPEPPSEIIWDLIQRAGAVVGLLDIFLRIFVGLTA